MGKLTMTRTDLARLTVQQILDDLDRSQRALFDEEQQAARAFRDAVQAAVIADNRTLLENLCAVAGTEVERLDAKPLLELFDDNLASPPDVVDVRVSDGNSYDCRVQVRLRLPVQDEVQVALMTWVDVTRRYNEVAAEHRSVKAQDAKARAKMIEAALAELPEGAEVMAALAKFKAAVKVLPDH